LLPLPLAEYDFNEALAFLRGIAPVPVSQTSTLPEGFAGKKPIFVGTDKLSDGIERESRPLPLAPIEKGCAFIREALETGGKDYAQPMWNLTTLAATFMEDGHALAHRMGQNHPEYTAESTDELWARKNRERADRRLGWPSCKTIQANGCRDCATCSHFAKGKSPLNLGLPDPNAEFIDLHEKSPVSILMALHAKGAGLNSLFLAMNKAYAVVKYGTQILVATIGDDICLMKVEDFHKMLANIVVIRNEVEVAISRLWFKWKDRRQYLGAGVVFQPGGPAEIKCDMLNLWRGFGIKPMPGDWSLLRNHIFKEVCSGRQEYFDYLIHWMAYAVQHPDRPMGVAVAFLGAQGAGKGIVARTFGKFFGKHFAHIANGDQLTGRFNASIGMSCVVFLDEALWAGDKKGEGVLKALITEPSLQLEAKFRDPIRVENRLRIVVASNNDWAVPAGIGDRRWFVLNVADTYSGIAHQSYWDAVYSQIDCGGAAAMLHDLLSMDVSAFNVRAVPHTAAKAQQQVRSLCGPEAWLYEVLQEGAIEGDRWQDNGLTVSKDDAYGHYKEFSKQRHEWKPEIKDLWSKKLHAVLGQSVKDTRPAHGNERVRSFQFASLADCRRQFAIHLGDADLEWEPDEKREKILGSAAPPLQPDGNEAGGDQGNIQTATAPGWKERL
jgi:hypothetical protein